MPRGLSKRHRSERTLDLSPYLPERHPQTTDDADVLAAAKLVAAQEALEERGREHNYGGEYDESSFALSDDEDDNDDSDTKQQSKTAINVCRILLLAIIINSSVIGAKLRQRRKNRVPATKVPTGPPTTLSPTTLAPSTLSPTTLPPSRLPVTNSPTPKPTVLVFGVGVAAAAAENDDNFEKEEDAGAGFGVVSDATDSFGVVATTSGTTPSPSVASFGNGSA